MKEHEFNTGKRCRLRLRLGSCGEYHYSCADCKQDCTAGTPGAPATTREGKTRCWKCMREYEDKIARLPDELRKALQEIISLAEDDAVQYDEACAKIRDLAATALLKDPDGSSGEAAVLRERGMESAAFAKGLIVGDDVRPSSFADDKELVREAAEDMARRGYTYARVRDFDHPKVIEPLNEYLLRSAEFVRLGDKFAFLVSAELETGRVSIMPFAKDAFGGHSPKRKVSATKARAILDGALAKEARKEGDEKLARRLERRSKKAKRPSTEYVPFDKDVTGFDARSGKFTRKGRAKK